MSTHTAPNSYVVDQRHPAAGDQNPGTVEQPFKTISAAVAKLQPGDGILIKGGVYREFVRIETSGTAERPIVIQTAPAETVVVSGADLVTGWETLEDGSWKQAPWSGWGAYGANLTGGPESPGSWQAPQLLVDQTLYYQVASQQELVPGSFCFDPADGGAIYLRPLLSQAGDTLIDANANWWDAPVNMASADPQDHQIEVTVREGNVAIVASYLTLRGVIVRYNTGGFPSPYTGGIQMGSEAVSCAHLVVEDCVMEYGMGGGLAVGCKESAIRRCQVRYNGQNSGGILVDSVLEECVFVGNTTRGTNHGWTAGGMKLVFTTGSTIRRNQFVENDGPGFWFDIYNSGNVVEQNFCSYNSGPGIMVEISPNYSSTAPDAQALAADGTPAQPNILRNNICVGNTWDGYVGCGILLQMSSLTHVLNNTVIGNAQYGIFVRYHSFTGDGSRCVDNLILNNLCADNVGGQIFIPADPLDRPQMVVRNRSDYNLFFSTASWTNRFASTLRKEWGVDRATYARWGKTQLNGTYSAEEWFRSYGFDEHTIQGDPKLLSPGTRDFRLQRSSPAIHAGEATPEVTDDFLGRPRPSDGPPSIGALEFFPNDYALFLLPGQAG
jgi:hypothetical protein